MLLGLDANGVVQRERPHMRFIFSDADRIASIKRTCYNIRNKSKAGCVRMVLNVPGFVLFALQRLEKGGFQGYLVGGCIRDAIRGVTPCDWDICTDATPEEILRCFHDQATVCTGVRHGTVGVVLEGQLVEITTFRWDGSYSDGRHPDQVTFTKSLETDLRRRDFTINAMAYHPAKGVIDFFGGQADLCAGIIRCVGDARERFAEDALRIVRGLRFSSVLGFSVEDATAQGMYQQRSGLTAVSMERIRDEWEKTLLGEHIGNVLRGFSPIVAALIPELRNCLPLGKFHDKRLTGWKILTKAVSAAPHRRAVRWAVLLHPLERAENGEAVENVLRRFCYGKKEIQTIFRLLQNRKLKLRPEMPCVKQLLYLLGEQGAFDLIGMKKAIAAAKERTETVALLQQTEDLAKEMVGSGECYSLDRLAVTGADLIQLGIPAGPSIGVVLKNVMAQVLDGRLENDKENLLRYAKEVFPMD